MKANGQMRAVHLIIVQAIALSLAGYCQAADSAADLRLFSRFEDVIPEKLADGTILAQRGQTMSFRRGISVQTCFVVLNRDPQQTAKAFQNWDPSPHPETGVLIHRNLNHPPVPGDFQELNLNPRNPAIRWLTEKTTNSPGDLQLSSTEMDQARKIKTAAPDKNAQVSAFWKNVLLGRAVRFFEKGYGGADSYRAGEELINPRSEMLNLLKEESSIRKRFHPILSETLDLGDGQTSPLDTVFYWEILDVTGQAILNLGVIYLAETAGGIQILDTQYYCSGTYHVSVILYQLWPVSIAGKPATLVWRGDFLSSASLGRTKGIERMAYGSAMLQEIKIGRASCRERV